MRKTTSPSNRITARSAGPCGSSYPREDSRATWPVTLGVIVTSQAFGPAGRERL